MKSHTEAEKTHCSFCGDFADDDLSIVHRHCGGRTHADCLPSGKAVNYKLCGICTGETVSLSDVASMDVTPPAATQEPFPPDGIDYVLQPGSKPKQASSAWRMVAGLLSRSKSTTATANSTDNLRTSQDPEFLLKNRVPVRDMLRFNKLGLQHMLKAGIDMSDFLSNGYTWNDLLLYADVGRKGATRAKQTLVGLKCTANHFRDYPDALPYVKVASHAQLQPYDLCTHFGLGFPVEPPGALQCVGDENWTARDCVRLGLKMDDLMDFGLVGVQQYEDLMVGLSKPDAVAAERELKVTAAHIGGLIDLLQAPLPPPPVHVPVSAPVPVPQKQQPQQREPEIVMEQQHPIRQSRPIVVVAAPIAPAPAATARVPLTQLNAKSRFDRHGALVRNVVIK